MGVEEDLEDLNALAESPDGAVDSQALASAVPPRLRLFLFLPFLRSFDLWRLCPSALPFSGLSPPAPKKEEAGSSSDSDSEDDDAGRGGAVPGSTAECETTEESRLVWERHEKAMQDLVMKRRGAALAVPTNDKAVRAHLRWLGELMTLFGEREMERRDRLRMLTAKLDAEGQLEKLMTAHEDEEAAASAAPKDVEEEMLQYPFYAESSKALLDARIDIAKFLIARAALRLERARRRRERH